MKKNQTIEIQNNQFNDGITSHDVDISIAQLKQLIEQEEINKKLTALKNSVFDMTSYYYLQNKNNSLLDTLNVDDLNN